MQTKITWSCEDESVTQTFSDNISSDIINEISHAGALAMAKIVGVSESEVKVTIEIINPKN